MPKKYLILFGTIIAIIIGFIAYESDFLYRSPLDDNIQGVSVRAWQFLESQQNDDESIWNDVDFITDEELERRRSAIDLLKHIKSECFSVSIPFVIFNPKTEIKPDKCIARATLSNQMQGYITISLDKSLKVSNLDELSGVSMRSKNTSKYTEREFGNSGYPATKAFESEAEVIYFLQNYEHLLTIAFYELGQITVTKITNEDISSIISSLEIH